MKLFNEGVYFPNWSVVYVGLAKGWLTVTKVLSFCEAGQIKCSEERFVELYLANQESAHNLMEVILRYIEEDMTFKVHEVEFPGYSMYRIPEECVMFWETEILLGIIQGDGDKENKLHVLNNFHSDFDYPEGWHSFIYFMPPKDGVSIGVEGLYSNLLAYVSRNLMELREK